jgi:hypothetical protein
MQRQAREAIEERDGGARGTGSTQTIPARTHGQAPHRRPRWRRFRSRCDHRLAVDRRAPGAAARGMNLMRAVLEVARRHGKWMRTNSMRLVFSPRQRALPLARSWDAGRSDMLQVDANPAGATARTRTLPISDISLILAPSNRTRIIQVRRTSILLELLENLQRHKLAAMAIVHRERRRKIAFPDERGS